jgi:hypothetical protein
MFLHRNRLRTSAFGFASIVVAGAGAPAMGNNLQDFMDCLSDCGFVFQNSNDPNEYLDCTDPCFFNFYTCPHTARPRFDLTSEAIAYAPGQTVTLRIGNWGCGGFLVGAGNVIAVRVYIVGLRDLAAATTYLAAPWQQMPTPSFDPGSSRWIRVWNTAPFVDPRGYAFRVEMDYATSAGVRTESGVNVAVRNNGCYANCDGSTIGPVLNVGDFTCFLQRFAAGDSYANCDASTTAPSLNVGDFTCFLQRFAAGCH